MVFEYWMLFGAVVLGLVHVSAASFTFQAQVGKAYGVGPRDADIRPAGMAGRLDRALRNFLETFPLFAVCVLLVGVTENAGPWSEWGSALYLGARILYLPLYASGIPWLRTITWNAASLGLVITGAQLLL